VNIHGATMFWPMVNAWVAALLLFVVAYRLRHVAWPKFLIWLGAISYSIYLWHLIVMEGGRRDGEPPHVYVNPTVTYVGYVVVTILVSWLSYRLLERPAIHLGHRLAKALARRGNQKPTPDPDAPDPPTSAAGPGTIVPPGVPVVPAQRVGGTGPTYTATHATRELVARPPGPRAGNGHASSLAGDGHGNGHPGENGHAPVEPHPSAEGSERGGGRP
jgi:hypothetical protein